ncbi:MAG: DNA-binding protein WhiA [Anaerovoracaceae bacterium]
MSFSSETKKELSGIEPEKKCCQLAEIAGFLRVAGSLRLAGGGHFDIMVTTDSPATARHYVKLIKEYFHTKADIAVMEENSPLRKGHQYSIVITSDNNSESILRETGILMVKEGSNYLTSGIYSDVTRKKCDRKAYLRGLFMGAGSVSDPARSYHLEFVAQRMVLADDIRKLLGSFGIIAGVTERRGRFVTYVKNSEHISRVLALIGADSQVLKFENSRIRREMVGDAVRITNCDTANTDRIIDASERQLTAIRKIADAGRMGDLPEKLRETAELRLEHPEASLQQLGDMSEPKLKKSGINNRLKKLEKFASNI